MIDNLCTAFYLHRALTRRFLFEIMCWVRVASSICSLQSICMDTVSRFPHVLRAHPFQRLCNFLTVTIHWIFCWFRLSPIFVFPDTNSPSEKKTQSECRHRCRDSYAVCSLYNSYFVCYVYIHLSLFYFSIKYILSFIFFFLFLFNLTYIMIMN